MASTTRDIFFWGTAAAVFVLLSFWGIDLGIYESGTASAGISPRAYPRAALLLLCAATLQLTWESIRRHKQERARPDGRVAEAGAGAEYSGRKLALTCAVLIGYYIGLHWLGIVPASTIIFLLLCLLGGERRMGLMLCIGAALATALYYFFLHVASIPMPTGPFGGVI
jgi:hypothetical protein